MSTWEFHESAIDAIAAGIALGSLIYAPHGRPLDSRHGKIPGPNLVELRVRLDRRDLALQDEGAYYWRVVRSSAATRLAARARPATA